jgi:hypothetical protein
MLGLKSRTFWTILIGVNITSAMLCAFTGNVPGVVYSAIAIGACYYMLMISDKKEDDSK